MRGAAKSYERTNDLNKGLLGGMEVISGKMAMAFSKEVDSSDACHEMIDRSGADISILIKTGSRTASIRSVKSDMSALAMSFGGGGHPHAAGFEVPRAYDIGNAKGRKRLLDAIAAKSKKLGLLR